MSAVCIPEPVGLGSTLAESLHSIIQRTAAVYGVPTARLHRLVCAGGSVSASPHDYTTAAEWIGRGELTKTLIRGLAALTGKTGFERMSLVAVSNSVGQSRELFARKRRVCSKCIAPEVGTGYGMLAHQLKPIAHCPLHGCRLLDRCPQCMNCLGWNHDYFKSPRCPRCAYDIRLADVSPLLLDPYSLWRERQIGQLVAYATSDYVEAITASWIRDFRFAVKELAKEMEQYSSAERLVVRELVKRFNSAPEATPSVHTLLRVCTMQSVHLCDLLRSPKECCSPRLMQLGDVKAPSHSRPTHGAARWSRAKVAMERLIEDGPDTYLPPLHVVAQQHGLSAPGMWRRYATETARYREERAKRGKRIVNERMRQARYAAHLIALEHRNRGTILDIRRDGARVMLMAGVTKAQAEHALNVVRAAWRLIDPPAQEF